MGQGVFLTSAHASCNLLLKTKMKTVLCAHNCSRFDQVKACWMDGRMDGRTDVRPFGRVDKPDGRTGVRNVRTDGQNAWMNGWIDGLINA